MNQAHYPFSPSRFATLRSTAPVPVSWETLISELTGPYHEKATRQYRQTLAALQQAEQTGDTLLLQKLKKEKERIKQNQPAFTASVALDGGRTAAHITRYSGFIMVDIDSIPPGQFAEALRLVREDAHTFLAHTTISGSGIRVFARMEKPVTKQLFPLAWQKVNAHYARLTGIDYDPKCKNATRMSVICHAPDALYRPDALPFPLPEEKEEKKTSKAGRPPRACPAEQAEETVRALVEREGIKYCAHSHNDYICRCLYWMNRFGVAREDAEKWALAAFADYDAASVCSTVKSCYALTAEHGTRRLKDFQPRASAGRPAQQASVETMERFVEGYMDIRRNRLTQQAEVKLKGDSLWQRMSDTIENSLWCTMQKAGVHTDLFRLRTLLSSDFVREFHPLTDYLDSLPPWDGTGDPIGELAAKVHTADNRPERFAFCFRRWLVALLAGALDERVVNQVIFVLIGRQGSYKTSFMQNLLPPCLRRYFTTKTNSQRLGKDDLLSLSEFLLINFEEIDSMRPAELNQLKAMTTALYIDERMPYGRNKVRLPHVASFCATGNNPLFLTDDTGNRRWLVFEVTHIDNPWEQPFDHDAIYAQAKSLLDSGFRYWFEDKEINELNHYNRRFETPNPARELLLTYYRKPGPQEKGHYLTASQIVARFGSNIRLTTAQVGRMLKELNFTNLHTRHGNFWLMVERTTDEINTILPEKLE
ncbi:MAG: DUF3874 domain-containing protein [Parabacteroides sp.]|nr:DUF3874 domain-containing protein [Parabacteroides sp.]